MREGKGRSKLVGALVAAGALVGCSVGYTIEDAGKQVERGNVGAGLWSVLMLPVILVADVATFGSISQDMQGRREARAQGPEALAAYNEESEARARAMREASSALPQGAVVVRPGGVQTAQGGQCVPGPRCNALQQRATPIIQGYSAGMTPSVNNSAMVAFCTGTLTAEVLRNCAAELHEMGRPDCARMVEADMQSFDQMARQAESTSRQTTVGNWRQQCGWRG